MARAEGSSAVSDGEAGASAKAATSLDGALRAEKRRFKAASDDAKIKIGALQAALKLEKIRSEDLADDLDQAETALKFAGKVWRTSGTLAKFLDLPSLGLFS